MTWLVVVSVPLVSVHRVSAPTVSVHRVSAPLSRRPLSRLPYIYIGVSLFFASAETFFSEFLYFIFCLIEFFVFDISECAFLKIRTHAREAGETTALICLATVNVQSV